MSRSSFLSLYQQGRYYRAPFVGADEAPSRQERHQHERFTAAALVFCCQHDPTFRQHFWERICRLDGDPATPASIGFEVEPHRWADVLVRSTGLHGALVHVVECKIGAGLANHQNPKHRAFAEEGGYGFELHKREGARGDLRYVLLGGEALDLPNSHPRLPIRLAQRRWADLDSPTPTGSLIADLFAWFAVLQLQPFAMNEARTISVAGGLSSVGNAFLVLRAVCQSLGAKQRQKDEDIYPDQNGSVIGIYVKRGAMPLQGKLQTLSDSDDILAWVGYFAAADDQISRAAWLYFKTAKKCESTFKNIQQRFPNTALERDEENYCVAVKATVSGETKDVAWFQSVFEAAGASPK